MQYKKKRIYIEQKYKLIFPIVLVVLGLSTISYATPMSRVLMDPPIMEFPNGETTTLNFTIYGVNVDPYIPGLYSFQIEDNEKTPFNDLAVIKEYSIKQPMLVGPMVGRLSTQTATLTIITNGSAAEGTYKPILEVVDPMTKDILATMEFTIISSARHPVKKFENVTYDFMNIQFILAPTKEIYKYVPADFQVLTTANPNVSTLIPMVMSVTSSPFGPYKVVYLTVPVLQYPTAPPSEASFYPIYTYTDNPAFKEYLQRVWNTDEVKLAEIDTQQNVYNDTGRDRCVVCHPGQNRIVVDFATLKDSNGTLMNISGKSEDGRDIETIPVRESFIHSIYHDIDKNNITVMQVDRSHTNMQALESYDVTVKKNSLIWELIGGNDPEFCKNCHADSNPGGMDEIKERNSRAKQNNPSREYSPHVIRSISQIDIKETQLQYIVPRKNIQ